MTSPEHQGGKIPAELNQLKLTGAEIFCADSDGIPADSSLIRRNPAGAIVLSFRAMLEASYDVARCPKVKKRQVMHHLIRYIRVLFCPCVNFHPHFEMNIRASYIRGIVGNRKTRLQMVAVAVTP